MQPLAAHLRQAFQHIDKRNVGPALPCGNGCPASAKCIRQLGLVHSGAGTRLEYQIGEVQ